MKNLLYTLFLICICFIESNGGVENNISYDVAPTDSVWYTVVNAWESEVTEEQYDLMDYFTLERADSIWLEYEDGWEALFVTNAMFDTILVHEVSPEGRVGYQFLIWTEE